MAQVIEFYTRAGLTPTVKRPTNEQRGKVVSFMSQREVLDELVCAAYEEVDSESSRWPDEAAYQVILNSSAAETDGLENSSNAMAKRSSVSSTLVLFFDDSPIESGDEAGIPYLDRLLLLFLVLFWIEGHVC